MKQNNKHYKLRINKYLIGKYVCYYLQLYLVAQITKTSGQTQKIQSNQLCTLFANFVFKIIDLIEFSSVWPLVFVICANK